MKMWLEQAIKKCDQYANVCKHYNLTESQEEFEQIADWLRELQERQKDVNQIPFKELMIKYGFKAPDMNVTEFVEDILPSAQPEIIRCKDCKHYHTDVFGQELGIEGLYGNLIVAHNACDKWSEHMNSVDPDGFCFLAERRTDAAK